MAHMPNNQVFSDYHIPEQFKSDFVHQLCSNASDVFANPSSGIVDNEVKSLVALEQAIDSKELLSLAESNPCTNDIYPSALTESGSENLAEIGKDEQETRKRKKKGTAKRTIFTEVQLMILERKFIRQSFLSREERQDLAEELDISERQVMVWFQNRRGRFKKRGSTDLAYNPIKLKELNTRRPYPFLSSANFHLPAEETQKSSTPYGGYQTEHQLMNQAQHVPHQPLWQGYHQNGQLPNVMQSTPMDHHRNISPGMSDGGLSSSSSGYSTAISPDINSAAFNASSDTASSLNSPKSSNDPEPKLFPSPRDVKVAVLSVIAKTSPNAGHQRRSSESSTRPSSPDSGTQSPSISHLESNSTQLKYEDISPVAKPCQRQTPPKMRVHGQKMCNLRNQGSHRANPMASGQHRSSYNSEAQRQYCMQGNGMYQPLNQQMGGLQSYPYAPAMSLEHHSNPMPQLSMPYPQQVCYQPLHANQAQQHHWIQHQHQQQQSHDPISRPQSFSNNYSDLNVFGERMNGMHYAYDYNSVSEHDIAHS